MFKGIHPAPHKHKYNQQRKMMNKRKKKKEKNIKKDQYEKMTIEAERVGLLH
jgi:hypothetical protein